MVNKSQGICGNPVIEVRKKSKVRNQQSQIQHPTLDTLSESDKKSKENITYKRALRSALSQQARNRQDIMTDKHETQIRKKGSSKETRLGTLRKDKLLMGLNMSVQYFRQPNT